MPETDPDNEDEPRGRDPSSSEIEQEIEEMTDKLIGKKAPFPALLYVLNEQIKDLIAQQRQTVSELIRIRAELEDKTIDEALEESNERMTPNENAARHNFLKTLLAYAEDDEKEEESSTAEKKTEGPFG